MKDKDPNFEEEYDLDPEDSIRLDNQIKKLTLELSGAKFMSPMQEDGESIPPEIESKFLDYILEFDKIQKSSPMIPIRELIKNPKFKSIDEMDEKQLSNELEKVQKKLFKYGIAIMSIKPVSNEAMYGFLIGDFLDIPIHENHLNGIIRQFIYEEFCPNAELDVERAIFRFNQEVFDAKTRDENQVLKYPKELIQKVELFDMLYEEYSVSQFEIIDYNIKKFKASIQFELEMETKLNDSLKTHSYAGKGTFQLKKSKGEWMVIDYTLPERKK